MVRKLEVALMKVVVLCVLLFVTATLGASGFAIQERLAQHRNLGKAFYENPTTPSEAVTEFKAALDLAPGSPRERLNYGLALLKAGKTEDGIAELLKVEKQAPSIPHAWFTLGVIYKRDGKFDLAVAQLEQMAKLVPDEPVTRFNLGALYKLSGEGNRALEQFELAARLAPELAGPHYQLYLAYRSAGRAEDAERELARFQEIRASQEGAAVPEDLSWSRYSEILDDVEPEGAAPATLEAAWKTQEIARGLDPTSARLVVLDADGDGKADLLVATAKGLLLFSAGAARMEPSGLEAIGKGGNAGDDGVGNSVRDAVPGDVDDDGRADLCVVTERGAALYRNANGRFERFPAKLPAGDFRTAVWLDVDHDYDLDLILLGKNAAYVRNPGAGSSEGWTDRTADFPFVPGAALAGVAFHAVSDTQGTDLAVTYSDRPGVLYRDRLGGKYEATSFAGLLAGTTNVAAEDLNGDGWIDLRADGASWLNPAEKGTEWLAAPGGTGPGHVAPIAFVDPDNSGRRLLVAPPSPGASLVAAVAADFDGDGKIDLASLDGEGVLRRHSNATPSPYRSLSVSLSGVKNLKLAAGSEVEVKAGRSYQKQTYHGVPLVFGLGAREKVDAVRVTWPNGLIQNETEPKLNKPAASLSIVEAPRLSGSCPMIFTWNGSRFEFVSDVLGVAPLGASAGDGTYFPVDHDEHVQIPRGALVEVDGRYEIRMTEELREVAFLDRVRLMAVDHPESTEIFVNDKFQDPPFPDFELYGIRRRIRPISARDGDGRDVLGKVLARDRTYPDAFPRDAGGTAQRHRLDLDFGDFGERPKNAKLGGRALLVLSGWVDWADGSTFLGAAQRPGGGLEMPRLSVQDEAGNWVTAIPSMGIPAGKPKTIVVDLSGAFRSASRKIRIETNLCVYWDEIFLAEDSPELPNAIDSEHLATALEPVAAELRFRGFSRPVIHPERKQPESFDYQTWMPISMWNPTPGLYTRYGDVRPLLSAVDDGMVVMGSGDEVRMSFDAAALPPLPESWARDFLLEVDGWAKDADANTAYGQSVEPLPFHAMSRYPYPESERYPSDPEHERYRRTYNVRPALRLIVPLREEVSP